MSNENSELALKDSGQKSEPEKTGATKSGITWGAWAAVIISVVVYFVAEFVSIELTSIYPALKGWDHNRTVNWLNNNDVAQFFFVLLFEAATVGLIFAFIRWHRGKIRAIGLQRPKLKDPANSLLGFVIYFPIYLVVITILANVVNLNTNQQQDIGFNQSSSGLELILVFISLCVLVPIAEEIMFRGFLYSGLKKSLPLKWAALLTSVIFAIPHMLEATSGGLLWSAGVDVFILSFVLIWLRERTGRLYAGMGLHALKNFVAFAYLFLIHTH